MPQEKSELIPKRSEAREVFWMSKRMRKKYSDEGVSVRGEGTPQAEAGTLVLLS